VFDNDGRLVETPFVPSEGDARLTEEQAVAILFRDDKVAAWLDRYPPKPATDAEYRPAADEWVVKAWSGKAGQIVLGKVDDRTGEVKEAWTGPQVAWSMARGGAGAFGGKTINGIWLWLTFCALFLVGLADLRRPLSLRNLDLLALLSFSISLRFFNEGEIFWSAPLAYPPLLYLLARCVWVARRDRPPRSAAPVWPVWLLAAACVFLVGFRVGLNVEAQRSVIDVGFAGVVGAERIANGQMPYGHMPVQEDLKPCGTADAEGEIRERIQTNGRCEASNPRRSPTSPTCLGTPSSGGQGSGTSSGPRMRRRSSSTRSASSAWRSWAGATAVHISPRHSRSPGRRIRSPSTHPTRIRTTRSCRRS
jgi:hypothetical protein